MLAAAIIQHLSYSESLFRSHRFRPVAALVGQAAPAAGAVERVQAEPEEQAAPVALEEQAAVVAVAAAVQRCL